MKPKDVRASEMKRTKSCGNIFIDLGFEPAEAKVMLVRADLMLELARHITAQGWTQAEAAKLMGITQPRVSKLMKRKMDEFSLDMLFLLAERLGLHHELKRAA
jgi:predicted XRE-type DNA-binding protein